MKYLPILEELFSSDSIIFGIIGLVMACIISVKMKGTRNNMVGVIGSIFVYAVCEAVSNVRTNFMVELLLLFIGTTAIGSFMGFLIGTIWTKVRRSFR